MGNIKDKTKDKILTALNQAAGERFTFEYGCCSSKDGYKNKKKEREERKGTVTVHHKEWREKEK